MPRAGRRRKKTRTHVAEDETVHSALSSAEALKVPKSLVVRSLYALLAFQPVHGCYPNAFPVHTRSLVCSLFH